MLESFKDDVGAPASAHRKFQRWRSHHPDGFFLNVRGKRDVKLHRALCTHSGDVHWIPSQNGGGSLTQRPKICSASARELLDYALKELGAPAKPCQDCTPNEGADQTANIDHVWDPEVQGDAAEQRIRLRKDIGPTLKETLIRARRGQGVFRENLERIEPGCRLTGLLDRRHLRASHIKPWCECSDAEKLDGFNGLLLSPHIDHLFGRGYVSFSDRGDLRVSEDLNPLVLEKWGIALPHNVGAFRPEQCRYLEYHRAHVFEKTNGGRRKGETPDLELIGTGEPAVVQPAKWGTD